MVLNVHGSFVYIKFCTGGLEFANLSHLTYNVFYGKQNVEQASLFPPPQIEITLQTGADWLWQRWTETFDTDCFSSFLYLIIIFNFYGGGGRGRVYPYRYTVTTRMAPAFRWAVMRAVVPLITSLTSYR